LNPDFSPPQSRAVIALGSSLPFDALSGSDLLFAALDRLERLGLPALVCSAPRETEAWPDPKDPPFTNAVAVLNAARRSAQDVLRVLLQVETEFGRTRGLRNAPRTLDLDLLDFNGALIDEPELILPHPRLADRLFVIEPLAEIWPDWRHPVSGLDASGLLARLKDRRER
jgi:2-amino-4-hydroxy-6-hydroxymethyldihydropteridine diphosphokinase